MDTPLTAKLLHAWEVSVEKDVDETTTEIENGQSVRKTRTVKKAVVTKFALKQPTRRELRQAELFYGKRQNWYIANGFLTQAILLNKHLDLTGGVLSDKERDRGEKLRRRHIELEADLARLATTEDGAELKKKIQDELASIRTEMITLQNANEAVFSQTADARAQRDLSTWFALFLVQIERTDGRLTPYFEGETYEQKEEFMWQLEEKDDPLYAATLEKIATYVYWFNKGASTSDEFRKMEEEMQKQVDARAKVEEAAEAAAEKVPEPVVAATATA